MSKNRIQHYNPEFYLAAWIDPSSPAGQTPYLWQTDLRKRTISNKPPGKVGWLPYFYSVDTTDGTRNHEVERFLAKVESVSARVVNKVRRCEFNLTDEERATLAHFMGFQVTRSPSFRGQIEDFWSRILESLAKQHASNADTFGASVREWEEATDETLGMSIDEARTRILNDHYAIRADPSVSLIPIVESSDTPASLIFRMRWGFAVAPKDAAFVTTDCPVFWTDPSAKPPHVGVGLAAANLQLTFPISPSVCLVASWRGCEGALQVSHELFEKTNRHILFSANNYVFSQTKDSAEQALRWNGRCAPVKT